MCRVSVSPTLRHVAPPSVDLNTPRPKDTELRTFPSPVPTYNTDGFPGSNAKSPTANVDCPSESGCHVVPALVVFQTPPAAVPTYTVFASPSTPSMSVERPIMFTGPTLRKTSRLRALVSTAGRDETAGAARWAEIAWAGHSSAASAAAVGVRVRMRSTEHRG